MTRFSLVLPLLCSLSFAVELPAQVAAQASAPLPAQATSAGSAQVAGQGAGRAAPAANPQVGSAAPIAPGDPDATIRTTVNEVDLVFTVADRHGHFIKDLKQSDFALLDDQKAPSQVFRFAQETNLPLHVGLLIDTSTSIRQRFAFEQQAAIEFLLQILRPKSDRAFVEGFDVTPDFKQDWTNNLDLLTTGINGLRPGGGTAIFDAVYTGCHNKLLEATRGHEPARKAIIVISDGEDNQSHAYLDDAIKECQRADTIIYAISTNVSPSRDRGDDVLQKMADATGGRAFFPNRIEDMPVSFGLIQEELRSQYALFYKPADFKADGSFRTIYLFCRDGRYQVRAPKGYFAPRE
ncbi:MAG TPA: VWA domain-containing protein [Acidobacteriaceae bacterium]